MHRETLNIILKLKEWEEEVEKQKFANFLLEKKNIEKYVKEIEERFNYINPQKDREITSNELNSIYNEIQYLTSLLNETKEILIKIEEEVEKQREIYEESFKEKKKIERLYEKLIILIKKKREKLEEKVISDMFSGKYRSV